MLETGRCEDGTPSATNKERTPAPAETETRQETVTYKEKALYVQETTKYQIEVENDPSTKCVPVVQGRHAITGKSDYLLKQTELSPNQAKL